jgi:hypothetical protein
VLKKEMKSACMWILLIWSGVTRLKTYDTDILCNQNYYPILNKLSYKIVVSIQLVY